MERIDEASDGIFVGMTMAKGCFPRRDRDESNYALTTRSDEHGSCDLRDQESRAEVPGPSHHRLFDEDVCGPNLIKKRNSPLEQDVGCVGPVLALGGWYDDLEWLVGIQGIQRRCTAAEVHPDYHREQL
jgi:hypothetical protein